MLILLQGDGEQQRDGGVPVQPAVDVQDVGRLGERWFNRLSPQPRRHPRLLPQGSTLSYFPVVRLLRRLGLMSFDSEHRKGLATRTESLSIAFAKSFFLFLFIPKASFSVYNGIANVILRESKPFHVLHYLIHSCSARVKRTLFFCKKCVHFNALCSQNKVR